MMEFIRRIMDKIIRFIDGQERKEIETFCIGINSYINKSRDIHIVMLDYDNITKKEVVKDCKELSSHFYLSDFEIFSTKNGYHSFFWYDHIPYSRLKMILDYSRCDNLYKYISKFYEYKTIRTAGKYKTLDIRYESKHYGIRKQSDEEKAYGNLKREEYFQLKKMHNMINKNVLK